MDAPPPLRPAPWRLALEAGAGLDLAGLLLRAPALRRMPRGDGSPVLVLPGFGASDRSTGLLRGYLRQLGHDAQGWELGTNRGDVLRTVPIVIDRVRLTARHHGPVALVGWSLGGVIAREVAREAPADVRRVITLGSPVVGGPKYTQTARMYARQGADLDGIERRVADRNRTPVPVPLTIVYSRNDGVVDWRACIDRSTEHAEHIEVRATHLGMGMSAEVFEIIATRLAR